MTRTAELWLFVTKRTDRIDAGCASSGKVAGEQSDGDEAQRNCDERERVMRGDAEEDRTKETGEEVGGDEAGDDAKRGQLEGASQDELKNVCAGGAEGHADADLFVTLGHEIGDDAVNAEA